MKIILTLLLLLNIQPAFAQPSTVLNTQQTGTGSAAARPQEPSGAASSMVIQLGTKSVVIPSPEGFGEATSQLEAIKRFFAATEDPNLDPLAIHMPFETIVRLKQGEYFDLPFYTKVSIAKKNREIDYSVKDFSSLVSYMKAGGGRILDMDSPEMKAMMKDQNKSLSELLAQEVTIDLSQPVNLGVIEQTQNSYSVLILIKIKFQSGSAQKEKLMVSSATLMRLNQRLIFVYTYRHADTKEDTDILRNFTRKWVAQILKANAA